MQGTYYSEECVVEISKEDVFWQDDRAYCGKCGSELDMSGPPDDLVDQMISRTVSGPSGSDYDDEEDEEDVEALGFSTGSEAEKA